MRSMGILDFNSSGGRAEEFEVGKRKAAEEIIAQSKRSLDKSNSDDLSAMNRKK